MIRREKERCSGSYCQAVGFLVIKCQTRNRFYPRIDHDLVSFLLSSVLSCKSVKKTRTKDPMFILFMHYFIAVKQEEDTNRLSNNHVLVYKWKKHLSVTNDPPCRTLLTRFTKDAQQMIQDLTRKKDEHRSDRHLECEARTLSIWWTIHPVIKGVENNHKTSSSMDRLSHKAGIFSVFCPKCDQRLCKS